MSNVSRYALPIRAEPGHRDADNLISRAELLYAKASHGAQLEKLCCAVTVAAGMYACKVARASFFDVRGFRLVRRVDQEDLYTVQTVCHHRD